MTRRKFCPFRMKNPWYDYWRDARRRCEDPEHKNYRYYGFKGITFDLTREQCAEIWERDRAHEMDVPSIDRIDEMGHYTFDNCRFIELELNLNLRWNKSVEPDQWEE